MTRPASNIEAILSDLYMSEINASITWIWEGGMDVKLGDPLNGYAPKFKSARLLTRPRD